MDLHTAAQFAVEHPHQADRTLVNVVPAVEDERASRRARRYPRRRDPFDHRLEHLLDPDAFLGAGQDRAARVESDYLFDFGAGAIDVGAGQIDLVDYRHDFQPVVECHVNISQRLRLDPLAGVDHQ